MMDSGIKVIIIIKNYIIYLILKDITQETLEKMYEKFHLDDSDEQAEKHFLEVIDKSVEALFP